MIISQNASKPSPQILWLDGIGIFKPINQLGNQLIILRLGQCCTDILLKAGIGSLLIVRQQRIKQFLAAIVFNLVGQHQSPYISRQIRQMVLILIKQCLRLLDCVTVLRIQGRAQYDWPR